MNEKFFELIKKYSEKVERQIIGCGLSSADSESLQTEVNKIVQKFCDINIGPRPCTDFESPEYEQWYREMLVFGEIAKYIGHAFGDKSFNYCTPKNLKNHYGPRD